MSAPATWSVGVAVVRPDEGIAGAWTIDVMSRAIVERGWARGLGRYRVILGIVAPGEVPRHFEVPIALDGNEAVVMVGIEPRDGQVTIRLLEEVPEIEIVQRAGPDLEFDLHNRGDRTVRGTGFPSGWFHGELVALGPEPRVLERSVVYCGTGADPLPPLAPGGTTISARSPWAMGPHDLPSPGEHLWIVQLRTEGARELEWSTGGPDAHVIVVRRQAAIARVVVP